jgi:hypothetical protein
MFRVLRSCKNKVKARVVMTLHSNKSPSSGRPRKPVIKTPKRRKYKARYSNDQLLDAILEAAAKDYGISCSTLKDRLFKRVTREAAGRPTVLKDDKEWLSVERLVMQELWGFPLTTTDLWNIINLHGLPGKNYKVCGE